MRLRRPAEVLMVLLDRHEVPILSKNIYLYEDGFKINNKYFPAISRILVYLSTETISRPPKSHKTTGIPLSDRPHLKHHYTQEC
jgi:hypothetical protein